MSEREREERDERGPLSVDLADSRGRNLFWTVLWLGLGVLATVYLSAFGRVVGVILLLVGAVFAYRLVRALMNAPGTIRVDGDQAHLPHGLASGNTEVMPVADVKHVYFLRRAVPWGKSGPVLVVETQRGAFTYPRDWFREDKDQQRVASALRRAR